MLRTSAVRVLDDNDRAEVLALCDADPVANVFVSSRVRSAGLNAARLGAQMWGYGPRGALTSVCYAGANLVPVAAGPDAVHAYADRARRQGRRCSSIVGPADAVRLLWDLLEPSWGPARAIRAAQPVMVISRPPLVEPDPLVRTVRLEEFGIVAPACVAMFTEEVGVSPDNGDGGALYRARVAELIRIGRSFARIEDGRVVFKAEVGAVTPYACQVQGVWVHPDLRGRGHAVSGMAAVVDLALKHIAPAVTLYVNDFNAPAREAYRRVGFEEVGTFMSVLF
ncbi:GNAT family N-acetyltransferase [Bailinhaonella thermotolerans]|uniref:GNAT family N-acetyltransferase n=1 Tax=Bailinhaonella thermotolerans TaxID=1070861 RepID=A0A3A4A0G4_9ACTN|nr:GNAT family N-acetyltransferase [Bailinhaonella thermotolerans]RJL21775.1 GNAT family N-acetyltransferase [Bailinhaonella thermotolerans]